MQCPIQLPRLARPEGCYAAYSQPVHYYGPDWLRTSQDHMGRAPQHRILEGLTGAAAGRTQSGLDDYLATPSGLRHRPTLGGIFHRPIIGTVTRARSSATRPAGLRDPSGERACAAARCTGRLGSGRTRMLADRAEQWTRDTTTLLRVVRTRPFESLGLRPAREGCSGSNNAATAFL
jgi:hypothetical protein